MVCGPYCFWEFIPNTQLDDEQMNFLWPRRWTTFKCIDTHLMISLGFSTTFEKYNCSKSNIWDIEQRTSISHPPEDNIQCSMLHAEVMSLHIILDAIVYLGLHFHAKFELFLELASNSSLCNRKYTHIHIIFLFPFTTV